MNVPSPASSPHGSGPEASVFMACPLCESAFQPVQSHVLAVHEDAHLLYLQCRRCGTASLAIVTARPEGVSAVGAMTDLTPAEVVDHSDRPSVSEDDVIDFARTFDANEDSMQLFQRILPLSTAND